MSEPGPRIAGGRSADIFDLGGGRVLRRRRVGAVHPDEPAVMRAVHAAGYPVPAVHAVDGSDMELDRVDGIDLLTSVAKRPWRARTVGRTVADLHRELASIPIREGDRGVRARYGEPEVYVHGDLHPGNVLATSDGVVVIDWERAALGRADADVATTWLILAVYGPDGVPWWLRPLVRWVRSTMLRAFLAHVPAPSHETLRLIGQERIDDRNTRPIERERIHAFLARHAPTT